MRLKKTQIFPIAALLGVSGLAVLSQSPTEETLPGEVTKTSHVATPRHAPASADLPVALRERNRQAVPKGAEVLPTAFAEIVRGGAEPQLDWRRVLEPKKVGERVTLKVGNETVEGRVTENRVIDGDGYSTTVELDDPRGRLTFFDIGGRSGGGVFFHGKSAALRLAAGANGEMTATETTVGEEFCTHPTSVFPLAHEANLAFFNAADGEDGEPQFNQGAIPIFNSKPGAPKVIYMDFDGEVVPAGAWGDQINAASPNFSNSKIERIFRDVAEDFRPWNVNVTTERAVFDATPVRDRAHCIQTPTTTAAPGAGGVAFLRSFGSGRVSWSYNSGTRSSAQTISHEVGHMLGLLHDGDATNPSYYSGHGSGSQRWGSLMGAAFTAPITQWSKGDYHEANNFQDDLAQIGVYLPVIPDDVGDSLSQAEYLSAQGDGGVMQAGVIGSNTDRDFYSFDVPANAGVFEIDASTYTGDANLDIKLTLYDANGNVIEVAEPTNTINASISRVLPAGSYRLAVEGDSWGSPTAANPSGWTKYGSMGAYTLELSAAESLAPAIELPAETVLSQSGNANWAKVTTDTFDGVDALRAGDVSDNESSTVSMTVTGPGTVSFQWKVSSETNYDFLRFRVDGQEIQRISGVTSYALVEHSYGEGEHTLEWSYTKDFSVSSGADTGWIDQVVIGGTEWTGFEDWAEQYSLPAESLAADVDNDSIPNLLEYFYNSDPTQSTVSQQETTIDNGASTFQLQTRADLTGLKYEIYASTNLQDWTLIADGQDNSVIKAVVAGVQVSDQITGTGESPRVISITETGAMTKRFYQLKLGVLEE